MIVLTFLSQALPSVTDDSDQADGSSSMESESDGEREDDKPLSKLSKV